MSSFLQKSLLVLMMLWLPFFSTVAGAASVVMPLPHEGCHESMSDEQVAVGDEMDAPVLHHAAEADSADAAACDACGVCHWAGSLCLTLYDLAPSPQQISGRLRVPPSVSFHSISFAPLLPPPLVFA